MCKGDFFMRKFIPGRKIAAAFVCSLAMSAFLIGCGNDDSNTTTGDDTEAVTDENMNDDDNDNDENIGNDAGNAVDDAGEGVGNAVDDVGEGVGDAVNDIGDGAGDAVNDGAGNGNR